MQDILKQLGINENNSGVSTGANWLQSSGETMTSYSPVDGKTIASVTAADKECYEQVISKAEEAFKQWRTWPAPKRGEIVRQIGEALRAKKNLSVNLFRMKWERVCRKVMVRYKR